MSSSQEGLSDQEPQSTVAHQAIAFALHYDTHPELEVDADGSKALLLGGIANLRTLPPDSNFVWSQGYWQQKPGDEVTGSSGMYFDDGSQLHVRVMQPITRPKPDPSWRDDILYVSLRTHYEADLSQDMRVAYRIVNDGSDLLCKVDRSWGMQQSAIMEIDLDGISEESLFEALGGILIEGEIVNSGIDPDLDPDITELREQNDDYRQISDAARTEMAGPLLAKQLGLQDERPVGPNEVSDLLRLLNSL